jgi:hypothetical protein
LFKRLLVLALVLIPLDVLACGLFFPTISASPSTMDAQRVLMVWKANTVDVHVSVRASTEKADFAWVLPVADKPELALGSIDIFTALETLTKPEIEIEAEGGGSIDDGNGFCNSGMRGVMAGSDFSSRNGAAPVQVESGNIGNYEYDIVKAETVEEMVAWLEEDGYTIPEGAEAALAPYVAASMSFVWVKLAARSDLASLTDLQPIILTVPRSVNSTLSFPLALSASSASGTMTTQIYTLSDKRNRVTNYASTDLQSVADRVWELRFDFPTYEGIVDTLTLESGGRLVVTEFARDLRGLDFLEAPLADLMSEDVYYLTRLSARTLPENLRDATVTYAHEAPEVPNFVVAKDPAEDQDAGFPLAVLLVLLGLLGWGQRRPLATKRYEAH